MGVNVTGVMLCAKYAIIEMQKNEPSSGVIIGNSSVCLLYTSPSPRD